MKTNPISHSTSFGRAYTTKEMKVQQELCNEAKRQLGTENTALIGFDFSMPSSGSRDTGIGTTFSKDSQEFFDFMKAVAGINALQVGPQGAISYSNTSPYSSSVFSFGEHLIDLASLQGKEFEGILSSENAPVDIFKHTVKNAPESEKVSYNYVLDRENLDGAQTKALKAAFANFKKLPEDNNLKKEFAQFKKDNSFWLEKYGLYEALVLKNGIADSKKWASDIDRNLYSGKYSQEKIQEREGKLKEKYGEYIEYKKFNQFIADKQQRIAKEALKEKGIKLVGDCQAGVSDQEVWANKSCFLEGKELGFCEPVRENGVIVGESAPGTWGVAALDFSKLGTIEEPGETGNFLEQKFDTFFKRYEGVRIDAAWQLIDPYIVEIVKGIPANPQKEHLGMHIIQIAENSAKKVYGDEYKPSNIQLELLGYHASNSMAMTKGNYPHIHISRYAGNVWGRPAYYESKVDRWSSNYPSDGYTIGIGTHDDIPLATLADDEKTRDGQAPLLAKDLEKCNDPNLSEYELKKSPESFSKAKLAELFTAKNQFFTTVDVLGLKERINTPNTLKDNWEQRTPSNYEELYFEQASKGRGLNLPDALAKALKAKGSNDYALIDKLQKAAAVLRTEEGPLTQKAADKELGKDFCAIG